MSVEEFVEKGFTVVKEAFSRETAAQCRQALWEKHKFEPTTRIGIPEIYKNDDLGAPWDACWSPKLREAVTSLVGPNWIETGCGWWVVTFPGFSEAPWGVAGSWHIDGQFKHQAQSPVGLICFFLFSEVKETYGGTALVPGSHKVVAEMLLREPDGIDHKELSERAKNAVDLTKCQETVGDVGDVILAHPNLLHARSKNLSNVVRFMCNPAVQLKAPLRLFPRPDDPTPLERVNLDVLDTLATKGVHIEPFDYSLSTTMGFTQFKKRRKTS